MPCKVTGGLYRNGSNRNDPTATRTRPRPYAGRTYQLALVRLYTSNPKTCSSATARTARRNITATYEREPPGKTAGETQTPLFPGYVIGIRHCATLHILQIPVVHLGWLRRPPAPCTGRDLGDSKLPQQGSTSSRILTCVLADIHTAASSV